MAFEARLKAEFWVKAFIRRCGVENVPAMVVSRGEESAGSVLVVVNRLDGTADVYTQVTRLDGSLAWMRALGGEPSPETTVNDYVKRARERDRDIWVVEIENRQGQHYLTEPIEENI